MQTDGFVLFDTALGHCAIAWGPHAITGVQLPEINQAATRSRMRSRFPGATELPPPGHVRRAIDKLTAQLRGEPVVPGDLSDIELDMSDVAPFHQRVYALARRMLPGETMTYGEMARMLGAPDAARAVGQALGHNPFAPIVPCHRILAAGGRSGGFSADGGVRTK
ncbi:MAG: methylated-DNA--[protein]-cysteine S-methyltransferase, partial [Burkholderiaceae bacterium]